MLLYLDCIYILLVTMNSTMPTFTLFCRSAQWVQNCRRADLIGKPAAVLYKNNVFRQEHFEDSQFMNAQVINSCQSRFNNCHM